MPFSDKIIRDSKRIREIDPVCADYEKFETTEESIYLSLLPYASKTTFDILEAHFQRPIKNIIDATAHIGCDAINFHRRFGASVICLENDEASYTCLKKNLKTFNNGEIENYAVFCNCLDFIQGFKKSVDFVYIDPPWGGLKYREQKQITLTLEYNGCKIPLYNAIKMIFEQSFTKTVVVKVPSNFNFNQFMEKSVCHYSTHMNRIFKQKKKDDLKPRIAYYLLICEYRQFNEPRFVASKFKHLKKLILPCPTKVERTLK